MIPRRPLLVAALAAVAALVAAAGCDRVPLLAPSGSSITLTASANVLPANGTTTLIAQVIEASGTPPQTGTHVTFTTTLGTIRPDNASTDVNGQVHVTFDAGAASGTATITAISGGAGGGTTGSGTSTTAGTSNQIKIAIGTAAVGAVSVTASPATVPAVGGDSTVAAHVLDTNGSPIGGIAVFFSTTAGTLSTALATSDANGQATTVLHTGTKATVTASVGVGTGSGSATGASSGTVVVDVNPAPTLTITPPSTAPSAGLPASFTFAVAVGASGSAVKAVSVTWGDGLSQQLGALTGSAVVTHVYSSAGSYAVQATVTDVTGNAVAVTTVVTVITAASPTVIITPTLPSTCTTVANVSLQLQVSVPTGIGVTSVNINFGDSSSSDLGGLNGTATLTHSYGCTVAVTVKVTVVDTLGRTTTGQTTFKMP